jgi:dTDP-4-amino-4,6-dideoxygalactose transaminase
VHHQYAVTVAERDRVRADLQARGIGTGVHYPVPLHRQPAFAAHCGESLPVTDDLAARMISLPIQPEVAAGHEPAIAEALAACLTS